MKSPDFTNKRLMKMMRLHMTFKNNKELTYENKK